MLDASSTRKAGCARPLLIRVNAPRRTGIEDGDPHVRRNLVEPFAQTTVRIAVVAEQQSLFVSVAGVIHNRVEADHRLARSRRPRCACPLRSSLPRSGVERWGRSFCRSTLFVLLLSSIANAQGASSGFAARLAEADRLAWLTNWYDALPIYTEVEQAATKAGNRRNAMYAKFGRLRGQMQTIPLPDISEQIAIDLETHRRPISS
jgi:hypothetical protein